MCNRVRNLRIGKYAPELFSVKSPLTHSRDVTPLF